MTITIDFIQCENSTEAVFIWNLVATYFSRCDGFEKAQLVKVDQDFKTRSQFSFASLCTWSSASAWNTARDRARQEPSIIEALSAGKAKFSGHTMERIDGNDFVFSCDTTRCILLDVIYVQEANYTEMWSRCHAYMQTQPGYVNASLYKNLATTDDVKFINIAEWQRADDLINATYTEKFSEIVKDFKDDYSLYLSHRVNVESYRIFEEISP